MFVGNAFEFLEQHRMQEAIQALKPAIEECSNWKLTKEYTDISNTYSYLLDYFRQGAIDTERERVFTQLAGRLLVLEDRVDLELSHTKPTGFGKPCFWTPSDASYALEKLHSSASITEKCLMISSITLSLLRYFDPLKIPVLFEAITEQPDEVTVRAVTALDLTMRTYDDRIPYYPDLQARLQQLFSDSLYAEMLADVELQLERSLDTERIEEQMREDILPSILRSPMSPLSKAHERKDKSQEQKNDSTFSDDLSINPDWEQWMEQSGIEQKLRDITEMQMSGADVYLATFAQMKNFHFFDNTENWFRPFDPTNAAISNLFPPEEANSLSLQRLVMQSNIFCNSDKYSFCLALNQLPKSQRDLLRNQLREQKEALGEEMETSLTESLRKHKEKPSTKILTRQYMQDLYRFFHLSQQQQFFFNPFDPDFVHETLECLTATVVPTADCLCAMAELNIQRMDYPSADDLYTLVTLHYPQKMDATLWQKVGYCRQMAKRYNDAIEAFTMADVLSPGHPWTLLHLAQCYRKTNKDSRALEYYESVAQVSPDDRRVLWQVARLLMRLGRAEEALPLLQRLAYEEPDERKVLNLLTEAYLRTARTEQAVKQADRLMALPKVDYEDDELFIVACAYWLGGRREEALTLYQHVRSFDTAKAQATGIPQTDIPFLRDLITSLMN